MSAQLQAELELAHAKNHLMKRLNNYWEEIGLLGDVEQAVKGINIEIVSKTLTQVYLAKRLPIQVLVGMLSNKYEVEEILMTVKVMLYMKLMNWDGKRLVIVIGVKPEVEHELAMYQYPIPMIVKPEPVEKNWDSGYLTLKKNIIFRMKDSEGDFCLDHINRMNRIKLKIDRETVKATRLSWANLNEQKWDETYEKYQKRVKSYKKYIATTTEVIDTLLLTTDEVYLTHSYDKRGRAYCNGYHVNYMGADWNKAAVQFANKEIVEG